MSIVNCCKCAKAVDTDFDTDSMVYTLADHYCLDCCPPQCYQVTVPGEKYNNIYFIKAITEDEAIEIASEKYNVPMNQIKASRTGAWSSFMRDGDKYGWD